jgi:two-component system sensor histidine kinase and response regulator WspE
MTNGQSQNFSDTSMLDFFRTEMETHTATLSDGLLALKKDTGALDKLEFLARAMHSIKGGAKIVELEAVIQISLAIEECFVAALQDQVVLGPEQIDILLQGVDMLGRIAGVASEGLVEWLTENQQDIEHLVALIMGTLPSMSADGSEPPTPSQKPNQQKHQPSINNLSTGITDESMLELFRTEVETHTATLTDGLLALETNPGAADQLEALMRAAHSIKGGARVVELDAAVQLAHVMEDCFVAAQKNELTLTSEHIDILLQGVDMLNQIVGVAGERATDWLTNHQKNIQHLLTAISAILSGEIPVLFSGGSGDSQTVTPQAAPTLAPKSPSIKPVSAAAESVPTVPAVSSSPEEKPLQPPSEDKDRMVRVTATKIEQLMGLGGEVVVNARWLPSFSESLLSLKKSHNELFTILGKLQEILGTEEEDQPLRDLVFQAREKTRECNFFLLDRLNQLDMFTGTSANLSDRLYHEVISVRMRPFADGVQSFPRMVRDLAKNLKKKVKLEIIGKSTEVDRDILEKLEAPLTHLLSNAIDHGIESPKKRLAAGKSKTGSLRLEAIHRAGMLMITVADDGRGIDLVKLRQKILDKGLVDASIVDQLTETELIDFLFLPGFSTATTVTEISGRGVGLDMVQDMVHEVGGIIRAVSTPGKGVSFHLELPLTLSVIRTFLVEIDGEPYAFPLARIDRCVVLSEEELEIVEDRQYFKCDNDNVALVDIYAVWEIEESAFHRGGLNVVVISDRSHSYGLLVDKFIGEGDLVVRPLDSRLGKVPNISAVSVMLDGSPVLIFDVDDLIRSVDKMLSKKRLSTISEVSAEDLQETSAKRILVVDDSITVREMERKLLENRGYQVEVAVDGMDGWNAVRTENFDLVVSDIDMPRMNGIEFVTHIKQHDDLKVLPVIIISYKDSEAHRLQGLEAGANYYLTKSSFQDDSFVDAVADLIGEGS